MSKTLASAIGILLLNPIACSGNPTHPGADAGGGSSTVKNQCNTKAECRPDEICQQVIFPIMPPQGVDAGMSTIKLGECVAATGSGGAGNSGGTSGTQQTGGASHSGGNQATGGATSRTRCNIFNSAPCASDEICKQVMFPIMPPGGFGGGFSSAAMLGECYPAEHSLNDSAETTSATDDETWWQTAEAALRRT